MEEFRIPDDPGEIWRSGGPASAGVAFADDVEDVEGGELAELAEDLCLSTCSDDPTALASPEAFASLVQVLRGATSLPPSAIGQLSEALGSGLTCLVARADAALPSRSSRGGVSSAPRPAPGAGGPLSADRAAARRALAVHVWALDALTDALSRDASSGAGASQALGASAAAGAGAARGRGRKRLPGGAPPPPPSSREARAAALRSFLPALGAAASLDLTSLYVPGAPDPNLPAAVARVAMRAVQAAAAGGLGGGAAGARRAEELALLAGRCLHAVCWIRKRRDPLATRHHARGDHADHGGADEGLSGTTAGPASASASASGWAAGVAGEGAREAASREAALLLAASQASHLVMTVENAPTAVATALASSGSAALVEAAVRELAALPPSDWERAQAASGDKAGVRGAAALLEELSRRAPEGLARALDAWAPLAAARAHSLRAGVVAALAETLCWSRRQELEAAHQADQGGRTTTEEGDEEEDDDDDDEEEEENDDRPSGSRNAGLPDGSPSSSSMMRPRRRRRASLRDGLAAARQPVPARARAQLLQTLLERTLDASAHVRRAALAAWCRLAAAGACPLGHWLAVTRAAAGRLADRAALVRREASRVLRTLALRNPFSGSLAREAFENSLKRHCGMLEALGLGGAGGGDSPPRTRPGAQGPSANDPDRDRDRVRDRDVDPSSVGFPGTAEQLRTVVANLRLALEFSSELQATLPAAAAMLRGEASGDAPEACALISSLASLRVDGAAEAARGLLPLVFAREPAAREAACAALCDLYVGFGENEQSDGRERERDGAEGDGEGEGEDGRAAGAGAGAGAPDPAAAAARLASLAAGATDDELECVLGLVAKLSGAGTDAAGGAASGGAASGGGGGGGGDASGAASAGGGASPAAVGGFATAVVGVEALQSRGAGAGSQHASGRRDAAAPLLASMVAPPLTRAIARELWALAGRAEVEIATVDQELLAREAAERALPGPGAAPAVAGPSSSGPPASPSAGCHPPPSSVPSPPSSSTALLPVSSLRSTRLSMTLARRGALRVLSHLAAARPLWFGSPERAALRRAAATDPDAASASAALDALGRLAGEPRKADWEVPGFRRPGGWWTGEEDVRACVRALLAPPRGERRGTRWFEVAEAALRALFARHLAADAVADQLLQALRGRAATARAQDRAAGERERKRNEMHGRRVDGTDGTARLETDGALHGTGGGGAAAAAAIAAAAAAEDDARKRAPDPTRRETSPGPPPSSTPLCAARPQERRALFALARLLHAAGLVAMLRLAVVEDTLSEARKKAHADRDRAREDPRAAGEGGGAEPEGHSDNDEGEKDADPGGELAAAAAAAHDAQLEDDADDAEREILGGPGATAPPTTSAPALSTPLPPGLAHDAALALAIVEAGPGALEACPPALRSAALTAAARFAAADERLAGRFVAALLRATGWEDLSLGGGDGKGRADAGEAQAAAQTAANATNAPFESGSKDRETPLAVSLPVRDRRTLAAAAADVAARWPRAAGGAAGAVRLARAALRDPSPAVRGDAASALARLLLCGAARGPGAEAALAACLADPAPRARTAGRAYFAELSSRETRASAPFHDALPDAVGALAADPAVPPARARAAAIELLGSLSADRRGDEAAARVARRLPAAETPRARVTLAFALAAAPIGERAARAAAAPQVARSLRRALAEDPAVRAAVAQAIARARARGGRGFAASAGAGADEEGGTAAAGGEATGGREDLKSAIDAFEAALVAPEGDAEEGGESPSGSDEHADEGGAEGGAEAEGTSSSGAAEESMEAERASSGAEGGRGGAARAPGVSDAPSAEATGGRAEAGASAEASARGEIESDRVVVGPLPEASASAVAVKPPPAGDDVPRVRDAIPAVWSVKPEAERS